MKTILANLDVEWRYACALLPAHARPPRIKRPAQDAMNHAAATLAVFAEPGGAVVLPGALNGSLGPTIAATGVSFTQQGSSTLSPAAAWAAPVGQVVMVATALHRAACDWRISALVNHRLFDMLLRERLGLAHPLEGAIFSFEQLKQYSAQDSGYESWVAKAPLSASGGYRIKRHFGAIRPQDEAALSKLISTWGVLVVEPWFERTADFGLRGFVDDGEVHVYGIHQVQSGGLGAFSSITLTVDEKAPPDLHHVAKEVGTELAATGYRGPFTIDGFHYRDQNGIATRALSEVNARLTLGHVAEAWARRMGWKGIAFGGGITNALPLVSDCDGNTTIGIAAI